MTGRCVDSALVLGPLIHEFNWQPGDHDLLSAGTLAGHVIECGPQCTGGFSTDAYALRDGWADIGFPIAECAADGGFTVTKPGGTGGRRERGDRQRADQLRDRRPARLPHARRVLRLVAGGA